MSVSQVAVVLTRFRVVCALLMSQISFTGLLRLCSIDARDEFSLSQVESYRRDSAEGKKTHWYKSFIQADICAPKMGFVRIDSADDPAGGSLFHRVCFVSGPCIFGVANTSDVRFLISAKKLFLLNLSIDVENKMVTLPHSISATGLCRKVHDDKNGIYHEVFMMNRCLYSGASLFSRLAYVK